MKKKYKTNRTALECITSRGMEDFVGLNMNLLDDANMPLRKRVRIRRAAIINRRGEVVVVWSAAI